jgi:hypothetical protein
MRQLEMSGKMVAMIYGCGGEVKVDCAMDIREHQGDHGGWWHREDGDTRSTKMVV